MKALEKQLDNKINEVKEKIEIIEEECLYIADSELTILQVVEPKLDALEELLLAKISEMVE